MPDVDPPVDDQKPKQQRKKSKAQAKAELEPVIPAEIPSDATGTFFHMPELFRHFLRYLDGKTLACMARVRKGWTYDVAAVLYREISNKQLSKMSRGEVSALSSVQRRSGELVQARL